jgi:hypothetical protein
VDGGADVTECDSAWTLAGTPYTGVCEGCDFAFAIESTRTRADGTSEDCDLHPLWTYDPGDTPWTELALAYASSYKGFYGDTYQDVLLTHFRYETQAGWFGMLYTGAEGGSATFSGDDLAWTRATTEDVDLYTGSGVGRDKLFDLVDISASGFLAGGYSTDEDLGCGFGEVDVYTLDLAATGTVTISVDTVAADTAFDPGFVVVDPTGSVLGLADDSFDCTFPPTDYQCPAASVTLPAGASTLLVYSFMECTGTASGYRVSVGGVDTLPLAMDDAPIFELAGQLATTITGAGKWTR